MNTRGMLKLAREGRPDLLAANAAAYVCGGAPFTGALKLVAILSGRYRHSSGARLSVRHEVYAARRRMRAGGS